MMDQLQQNSDAVMSIHIRFLLVSQMPEYKSYLFLQNIVGILKGTAVAELAPRSGKFYTALEQHGTSVESDKV